MKKITIITVLFIFQTCFIYAQEPAELDDIGRIVLNSFIPNELNLPLQARNRLENKLNQIATSYGMGGNALDGRFVIMAVINVNTKELIPGPPQMVAQSFDVSIYIGDAIEDQLFSSTTFSLRGVGNTENESLINGIMNINQRNPMIKEALEEGKQKIVDYFESKCDFILQKASALDAQGKYDEAIFNLISVPEVCKSCYFKCLDTLEVIFQHKIDKDCEAKYNEAVAKWAVAHTKNNAFEVVDIVSSIDPFSACINDVKSLINRVSKSLREQERQAWEWKMKQYNDNLEFQWADIDLKKQRIEAYRQIGVEQAKHIKRIKIKNTSLFGVKFGSDSGIGAPY